MSNSQRRDWRDDKQKRKTVITALREAFKHGEESGDPVPASEVFDRLEAKYARMALRYDN